MDNLCFYSGPHGLIACGQQFHALLEMNMIQHELDDMTDIFGVKGLNKPSKIQLPRQDMNTSMSSAIYHG